ncbi:MAG: hypothetical protein F8N37_22055 [Telmatospirillum sp.]|nr:hypothetical protein [Telmatospirillum sp.]
MLDLIPYRIRRPLEIRHHHRMIAGITETRPIVATGSGLTFLSMVCHADVLPWLVSIKSIFRAFDSGSVSVINDGSLTGDDLSLLHHHVEGLRVIPISSVDTGPCPKGGTWERLLTILDLSRDNYVIQVDADLVASGPMAEVVEAVRTNRAFTLAGGKGHDVLLTPAQAAARMAGSESTHIQTVTERILMDCPELASMRYVRGCSGFAGFPCNDGGRRLAEMFSTVMERKLAGRWLEWGTEQITSNFLIANFPDPLILPWPKYMSYFDEVEPDCADLVHFLGLHRYHRHHYGRLSQSIIRALM